MADDDQVFAHDPLGGGDVYGLGGQLRWERLDDHVDALVAAGEAPDGECDRCQLKCCNYAITVPETELDRVTAAAARLGVAGPALFRVREAGDDAGARTLTRRDDGFCLFLAADERCRIHGVAGPASKPSVCQLYPGQPTVTPLGARVPVRAECPWPRRTRDPEAVARYGTALKSRHGVTPTLLVRVAPETVRISGETEVAFAAFDAWCAAAAGLVRGAETAMAGLDAAIALATATFAAPSPEDVGLRARTLAAALSGVLEHVRSTAAADAFARLACAVEPLSPRPTPTELVAVALESFEPLRFPTLMAGLGALRLFVAACDRDARSATTPNEVFAGYLRSLHAEIVRLPLARATVATLEAVAHTPGL